MVERWFAHLSTKAIRRGSFASMADLKHAIEDFLETWNENPRPFVWTATVDQICAKLSRCRQTLEQICRDALHLATQEAKDQLIERHYTRSAKVASQRRLGQ